MRVGYWRKMSIFATRMEYFKQFSWILTLVLIMIAAPSLRAQRNNPTYEGPGAFFIGADIGTSLALNENVKYDDVFKTYIPSVSGYFGYMFTPRWSVRLTGLYTSQYGHPSKIAQSYDKNLYKAFTYSAVGINLDLMLNLMNCFRRYDSRHRFDLYWIIGGGELYTFGFDDRVKDFRPEIFAADPHSELFWNAKTGFDLAWHMNRSWDLMTELDVFMTDNKFNGIEARNRQFDWFLSLRIGTVYYFRNGKGRHRFANPKILHKYWTELN